LRYRPNPDMMDTKLAQDGQVCFFSANLHLYCRLCPPKGLLAHFIIDVSIHFSAFSLVAPY
jgi:hypothetical protein